MAASGVAWAALRAHRGKPHLGKIIDAPVSADHRVTLPRYLQVLARMDTMNQHVEIDALRRFGSLGRIGGVGPLRRVCIRRVVTEDAHLDVVAIAPMQGQIEMTLVARRNLSDVSPGLDRRA